MSSRSRICTGKFVTKYSDWARAGEIASDQAVDRARRRIQNAAVASSASGSVDLELRPSRNPGWLRALPRASISLVGLFAVGLVVVWLERPATVGLAAMIGLMTVAAVSVVVVSALWLYRRNERIFVRGMQIGQVDMWGRRSVWSIASIKEAVSGSVKISSDGKSLISEVNVVLLIGRNGASMMSSSPWLWDPIDLERLWKRLGIEVVAGWTEPLLPEDLRRRYPGAVHEIPSSSMAPGKTALAVVGSFVLAIVLSICLLR